MWRPGRLDSLSGFSSHQIDHGAQRFLLRVAFQSAEAEMIELPVDAATFADDGKHVA